MTGLTLSPPGRRCRFDAVSVAVQGLRLPVVEERADGLRHIRALCCCCSPPRAALSLRSTSSREGYSRRAHSAGVEGWLPSAQYKTGPFFTVLSSGVDGVTWGSVN